MDIKISSKFAIVILGIGIFSTLLAFDKSFPVESANAQMNMGSGDGGQGMGGGGQGMGGGGSFGMGGGGQGMGGGGSFGMGGGGAGHGMMVMNVPGAVQQICDTSKDMLPSYCEPNYKVMSSVKGFKISTVNPIDDNELQVVIENINSMSNATTTMGQQNIVVAGGGGDLAGSTVLDIAGGGSQKITSELKLIGSGSIYNLERIYLHLLPL
ncbi:MAG TPA: hypothetical protein VLA74_01170, partial [Nitrososphaeraceae archaeon]|nr:hypothetical protein [Nitrososphaeraceae archaeon]